MYYKLNENLRMCGWDLLETGLVDRRNNQVFFLQPPMYQLLNYCTGTVDTATLDITEEQQKMFDALVENKVLEVGEEPFTPVEEWQKYKRYHNRLIKSAHWSITGRCNYRCRHCYMSAPHGKLGELSFEQCKRIIEEMADAGVLKVSLTGGEAMVHPAFWDIVDLLIKNDIKIDMVYSNAFLVNETFFEKCRERHIKPGLSLSFDGVDGAHAWLRGIPDAEEHFKRAVSLINENGFKYNVEMCLYKKSAPSLREAVRFLDENACDSLKINALSDMGEGSDIRDQIVDREEQYRLFMDYIPHYKEDGIKMPILACRVMLTPKGVDLIANHHIKPENADNYCLCGHARNSMYVSCTGAILPCIPYSENPEREKQFPNVLNTPLKEIFTKSKYFDVITHTLSEYLSEHPECAECEYKYDCVGGCPGKALDSVQAGEPDGIDEEICWHFKNKMNDKFKEISDRVFGEKK